MPPFQQLSKKWLHWYLHNSDIILLSLAVIDLFFLTLSFVDKRLNDEIAFFVWSILVSGIFLFDVVVKYRISRDKHKYLRENWWQVIIVVLPFLQAFRVFMVFRILVLLYRTRQNLKLLIVEKGLAVLFILMIIVAFTFGIIVLIAEDGAGGGNINTLEKAIWWAFVTMTTTGYGDYSPISLAGRIIGVLLMFVGIGLVAIFTAQLTAMIIESDKRNRETEKILREVTKLERELRETKAELRMIRKQMQMQQRKDITRK